MWWVEFTKESWNNLDNNKFMLIMSKKGRNFLIRIYHPSSVLSNQHQNKHTLVFINLPFLKCLKFSGYVPDPIFSRFSCFSFICSLYWNLMSEFYLQLSLCPQELDLFFRVQKYIRQLNYCRSWSQFGRCIYK